MGFRLERLERWVAYVSAAEGFGFPLVPAGAVEGACLGWGQSRALAGVLSRRSRAHWVLLTSGAAAEARTIGMVSSTLTEAGVAIEPTDPGVLAGVVVAALVLLATIPTAQWPVLRVVVGRAWRWIPLNMAAWLVGLVFTFVPSPFIDATTPTPSSSWRTQGRASRWLSPSPR